MDETKTRLEHCRKRDGEGLKLEDTSRKIKFAVSECKNEQEKRLLPLLTEAELNRLAGEETGRKVAELRRDWQLQVGAEVAASTPGLEWGKVEGRSLTETIDTVRVAVTKYNNYVSR